MREPAKDVTLWLLGPPGGGDLTGATAATDSPAESTRPARFYLAGVSSEVPLGWNKVDRGLLGQIVGPNGGLLLNWRAGE